MEELKKRMKDNVSKIKHKIVIMSGKGGVGKSTLATNVENLKIIVNKIIKKIEE